MSRFLTTPARPDAATAIQIAIHTLSKIVTEPIYVLLATYNGGAFLREQLDSLIAQTEPGWHLLVRDDGSSDRTAEIVAAYAAKDPRITMLPGSRANQGTAANFASLLQTAAERGADYVLLMDQDDVWLADKIERQMALMKSEEGRLGPSVPILVHSDLELVDRECRTIHPSFMAFQRIHNEQAEPLRTLLVQNYVTGCTVLLNRALLQAALPIPSEAMMHDWWLALIAATVGVIRYDPEPTVRYRQHPGNQVGAKGLMRGFASVWRSLLRSRGGNSDFARSLAQGRALKARIERTDPLRTTNPQYRLLASYCDLFEGPRAWYERVHGLRVLGLRRQWAVRQWLLYLHAGLAPAGCRHHQPD